MDQASYLKIGGELIANAILDLVEVTQELNEHWWCRVECRQTEDARFPFEQALGKSCQVFTNEDSGAQHLIFDGIVVDAKLEYKIFGSYGIRLLAVTRSWKLDQAARQCCYTTPSIGAIASQIVDRAGLSSTVNAEAKSSPLQYVQWAETDFAFLCRLADDHRCWLRPTAAGIEIQKEFQAGSSATFRDEYQLLSFEMRGRLGPASMDGAHYEPGKMMSQTFTKVRKAASFTGASGRLVAAVQAQSQSILPSGYMPQRARAQTLDDYQRRLELESERSVGSLITGYGISRVQQLKAGDTVDIQGAIDAKGTYGLTKVIHRWTQIGYENEFWCTPWMNYLHPVAPAMRRWSGVVPARVVAHSDPEKYGRIRVRFYWQEEGDPILWARMMTPHAGQDRGFFFQPEIGDEVMVMFEDGDVERPVIIGASWNGVNLAPTEDFWGGEYQPNEIKRIVTKAGHRIALVDKPGKESISLATPQHLKIGLFETANETGRPTIQVSNDNGDIILSAPNGRIHLHSKLFSREVGDAAFGTHFPAAAPPSAAPVTSQQQNGQKGKDKPPKDQNKPLSSAPSADDLKKNPTVQKALKDAWADSQANDPAKRHEEGGWIYQNIKTNEITIVRAPAGAQASLNLSRPPNIQDSVVVGKFHTHPNPTSEGWDPGPSAADVRVDALHGVPDLIQSDNGIYVSGPASRRGGLAGGPGFPP